MYKRPNVNLVHLLRDRQARVSAPGTQVHHNREFYTRIYPDKLTCQLQGCQLHLCKFTPCGRYLIAFDATQHELRVYTLAPVSWSYTGTSDDGEGDAHDGETHGDAYDGDAAHGDTESHAHLQQLVGATQPFDKFFRLDYSVRLTDSTDLLCKDFCMVLHDRFLLVASATPATEPPPTPPHPPPPPERAALAGLPLVVQTIFHLLDMSTGAKLDQFVLYDDLVNLSVHHSVALLNDMLAIVGVRSQSIFLLHVQPTGRLVLLQTIGPTCHADDELVLAHASDAETRWQQQQQQQSHGGGYGSGRVTPEGGLHGRMGVKRRPGSREGARGGGGISDAAISGAVQGGPLQQGGTPTQGAPPPVQRGTPPRTTGGGGGGGAQRGVVNGAVNGQRPPSRQDDDSDTDSLERLEASRRTRRRLLTAQARAVNSTNTQPRAQPTQPIQPTQGTAPPHITTTTDAAATNTTTTTEGDTTTTTTTTPDCLPLITGVQHRLLVFLYKRAVSGGGIEVQRLYRQFDDVVSLLMLKAQFLDPSHLLIAMGKAQNWLHRSTTTDALSSNSGIMLYNWTTGQVVDYFPAGTHDTSVLGELCTRAPVGEQVGSMWQRCIAPKMSVHSGHDALPSTSQMYQSSPYLDTTLFQYDEQLVPPTYKSRRYSTRDVKFVSKKAPAQLKFKLNMASLSEGPSGGPQPPQSRGLRLVKHLFHPWLPMVLAVLHNVRSLPETVVLYM